jgi:hypothetical protein
MTEPKLENHPWIQGIAMWVDYRVKAAQEDLNAKINALKEEIAQLKAKGVNFYGAYQRGAEYRRHDIVCQSNTMWIAVADVVPPNAVPGQSELWVLADKSQQEPRRSTNHSGRPR